MPLEGIRVLDLGHMVTVPMCSQFLAWMGADVILVETTTHPGMRGMPPFADGKRSLDTSGYVNLVITNKRSCTINIGTQRGVELVRQLVRISDVVMENFATQTMPRLGLAYPELRKLRSDIIFLSLGAFGRTGPMRDFVGLNSAVNVFSGVAALTGYGPRDRPRLMGGILPDTLGATAACLAVLEALYHRQKMGRGQLIDMSMAEVFASLIPESIAEYSCTQRQVSPLGNRDPYKAPQGVYRCKGRDAWVAISVETDQEWSNLCRMLGQPQLALDRRFARLDRRWQHQDDLDAIISAWTQQQTHYETMHALQEAGVPAAACLNAKELLNDSHLRARRIVAHPDHPRAGRRRMIGMPWKIDSGIRVRYRPAPCIGQHTEEVLTDVLGLSSSEVQQLRVDGVLT